MKENMTPEQPLADTARLLPLQQAANGQETALCLRIGGHGDPVPDVERYVREKLPQVTHLLAYNVSVEDVPDGNQELTDLDLARRMVEDIVEGVRAYSKGTHGPMIHFFPAGMISYPPLLSALLSNATSVTVYQRTNQGYAPLYQIDRNLLFARRTFTPLKDWQVLPLYATAPYAQTLADLSSTEAAPDVAGV